MTARFLTWAHEVPLVEHPGLSRSTERLVLVMLANSADMSGETWLAVGTMAKRAYMSRTTVRLALDALRGAGLITLVGRRSGGRTSTRWLLQPVSHEPVDDATPTGQSPTPTGQPPVARGSVSARNRSATGADPLRTRIDPAQNPQGARTRDATTSTGAPRASRRQGGGPRPPSKPSTPTDETRRRAEAVVRPWWERQQPRPRQPYIAIVKICEGALRGGWADNDLAAALDEIPVVSGAALDLWRNKRDNGRRRGGATIEGGLAVYEAIQRRRKALGHER